MRNFSCVRYVNRTDPDPGPDPCGAEGHNNLNTHRLMLFSRGFMSRSDKLRENATVTHAVYNSLLNMMTR